jgi:endonuclease/exonuclease/phosphatase family metal-dependent hydrolase
MKAIMRDFRRESGHVDCSIRLMLNSPSLRLRHRACLLALAAISSVATGSAFRAVQAASLPTFSEKDFRELAIDPANKRNDPRLKKSIDHALSTGVIDNSISPNRTPADIDCPGVGKGIRVTSFNVRRSETVQSHLAPAIKSDLAYLQGLEKSKDSAKAMEELRKLKESGIILLQEVMVGNKAYGNVDGAKEMAKALGMNYAFATHQLEFDAQGKPNGHFGSAVITKYKVKDQTIRQLKNQGFDWAAGWKDVNSFPERVRASGSKLTLGTVPPREVKVGGRAVQIVNLEVPGQKNNTVTVINVHLEVMCDPEVRRKQIAEIMEMAKDIENPVLVGGDFNATPVNVSPTSFKRMATTAAKDPATYLKIGAACAGAPTGATALVDVANYVKNHQMPLAWNLPGVLPNKQRAMWDTIEAFRFSDGRQIDFRGDRAHSIGTPFQLNSNRALGNSNQRGPFRFKATYVPPTGLVAGRGRLDFLLGTRTSDKGSYKGSLVQGETLTKFNRGQKVDFSDHSPITACMLTSESKVALAKQAKAAQKAQVRQASAAKRARARADTAARKPGARKRGLAGLFGARY